MGQHEEALGAQRLDDGVGDLLGLQERPGRLHDARAEALLALLLEAAAQQRRVELTRVEMMRGYAETTGCRRQFLLGYFGSTLQQPCGTCDTCAVGTAAPVPNGETGFAVQSRVRHAEWGDGIVMREEDDRLTVLFDEEGYRTLSLRAVRDNNLLTLQRTSE